MRRPSITQPNGIPLSRPRKPGKPTQGSITAIIGCMFSGKTTMILDRLIGTDPEQTRAFKHACDQRYQPDAIVSHAGRSSPAVSLNFAREIEEHLTPAIRLVAIDEAHFFDEDLIAVLRRLAMAGTEVITTSLDCGSWGQPMPVTQQLIEIADRTILRHATCARCGGPANHTQRLTPIVDGNLVGGPECYEPRCGTCWHPPPEPHV